MDQLKARGATVEIIDMEMGLQVSRRVVRLQVVVVARRDHGSLKPRLGVLGDPMS